MTAGAGTPPARGRIVVFGMAFWFPLAGVTFQILHYLLGLQRLGYDVYYVEDSDRWVYDPIRGEPSEDAAGNVDLVAPVLEAYGLAGRWAYRTREPAPQCFGLDSAALDALYRSADAMLNVTAAQELRDDILAIPRRIYVESDPFAFQVRASLGDPRILETLDGHDTLFTFGENVGQPGTLIPETRFRWLPTRQPVALDLWDSPPAPRDAPWTTVTTWHNREKPLEYNGENYWWTKGREFEPFLDLPERAPATRFELAVAAEEKVHQQLTEHGWSWIPAVNLSLDPARYRSFITSSRAEFTVARDQYVRPWTGWFSDRSACYLAAGRPVVTQDTGFGRVLPTGEGLFAFSTMDEVVAAIEAVENDYERHAAGARAVAAEYFSAERVLTSLMERADLF